MYARTFGAATQGVDGLIISVEVDSANGMPAFDILQDENFSDCACRFDVVEVYLRGERVEEVNHIENAFEVVQEI